MAITGQEPHCRQNDAAQTVDETSVATECHQSLYRSRHRAPHGYLLHSISPTITPLILLISHLHGNTNESYSNVVHPVNDDTRKADQAHQGRVDDTVGAQVAASSTTSGEDGEEEDPWKRKIHKAGCGGNERPSSRNDDDQDHDNDDNTGLMGEVVDVPESNNPDDFPNIVLDEDADIDENDMVEVGAVDEKEEEHLMGLWEE